MVRSVSGEICVSGKTSVSAGASVSGEISEW